MTAVFEVPGKPQGKARPRVTRRGAYTPAKTKAYEQAVAAAYRAQAGAYFGESQLAVMVFAYFEPPKSTSKKKRAAMLDGTIKPTTKPDADNIAKAVCDALNGIAYHDDAQITVMIIRKAYRERAGVKVCISDTGFGGGY